MDIKKEQMFWLMVATVFMAGMIIFLTDTAVLTALAWGFTAVVGIFIGADLATMLKKTSELPTGQYKEINKNRYVTALFVFASLMGVTFFTEKIFERGGGEGLYACFGMGFLFIIGGLVAGVECNKLVTDKPEKDVMVR